MHGNDAAAQEPAKDPSAERCHCPPVAPISPADIEQARHEAESNAVAAADRSLTRVDVKAGLLLAVALGLLTAIVALAVARPRFHAAAMVAAGGSGLLLAVAMVLLLVAVRPAPRGGPAGFGPERVRRLYVLTNGKDRLVRRAINLMITALVVLVIAIPAGLIAA